MGVKHVRNLGRLTPVIAFCAICFLSLLVIEGHARSAFSPRHSGLEPPGGPKVMDNMPGRSMGIGADGRRGYTDAYGNTIDDQPVEEKKRARQLRPGAHGSSFENAQKHPLPDIDPQNARPLWKF